VTGEPKRYIYKTEGVCPPEIHFQVMNDILSDIDFVGGGCPGNAELVGRLLNGRRLSDACLSLTGIECRNGTSCPDQLAQALTAVAQGRLEPRPAYRVVEHEIPIDGVAVIGELGGCGEALETVWQTVSALGIKRLYCLGNQTGESGDLDILKGFSREGLTALAGDRDYGAANMNGNGISAKARSVLTRLPQVAAFRLGGRRALAFYGCYLRDLPGYSDFEPYSLEINMVCDLTSFLTDEDVFPALAAMTPQFRASIILYGQPGRWERRTVGGVDFIGVGPVASGAGLCFGVLTIDGDNLNWNVHEVA
jgi:uncharacterized protein (TIGR03905 family)